MPETANSDYEKEQQWRNDAGAFGWAIVKHWHWWTCTTVSSGIAAFFTGGGRMIPAWVLWLFALSGLVIASFLAFCDQRRISEKHEKDKNQALELANSHFDKDETEHTKAALRKAVKDLLGRYLKIIDGQISNIELMDWNAATEANRLKEILYWSDVSMEISVFLKERFSEAESALFKSQSDMHRTPVNDELDWPQKQRQLLLDQMTHGSKQLRSIIEKLI